MKNPVKLTARPSIDGKELEPVVIYTTMDDTELDEFRADVQRYHDAQARCLEALKE